MKTMKVGGLLITGSVVLLLLCWGSSRQGSYAQTQSTAPSTDNLTPPAAKADSTVKQKGEKEKHWNGSLVDVNCMAKAMSAQAGATGANSARPSAGGPQREWLAGGSGQASPSGQMSTGQSRQPGALPPGQNPDQNPDISQAQAAQMAQADKLDNEAKQCVATTATTVFGLVPAGGPMMRFDDQGNTKAGEALRAATVEPGKRVKAKVTGVLGGSDTVTVSSVEIKGKTAKHASSASATQGGGR
jgi:hypothetical protein